MHLRQIALFGLQVCQRLLKTLQILPGFIEQSLQLGKLSLQLVTNLPLLFHCRIVSQLQLLDPFTTLAVVRSQRLQLAQRVFALLDGSGKFALQPQQLPAKEPAVQVGRRGALERYQIRGAGRQRKP